MTCACLPKSKFKKKHRKFISTQFLSFIEIGQEMMNLMMVEVILDENQTGETKIEQVSPLFTHAIQWQKNRRTMMLISTQIQFSLKSANKWKYTYARDKLSLAIKGYQSEKNVINIQRVFC